MGTKAASSQGTNNISKSEGCSTKALEQRVLFLEESLEGISDAFIDFTESMLKAEAIRQNPEILQNLLTTTSSITHLAKTAAPESSETTKNGRGPSQEELSAARERLPSIVPTPSAGSVGPSMLALNQAAPDFSLLESEIFGNGWFNLKPSIGHLSIRGTRQSDPDGDFAVKLIEKTMNMAYYSLLENRHDPNSFVMRMCRYALLYHSMDELLFNMRWFLGPGLLAMRSLCRANFGFHHTLSVQSLNVNSPANEAKILSPFVDAQALMEAANKNPRIAFINALDVEEYLKSKGAVHLDKDIVQIRVKGSSEAEGMENHVLDFDRVWPQVDVLANDKYFNQIPATEQDIFGIPDLTSVDSYFSPNNSPTQFQPEPVQSRTISVYRYHFWRTWLSTPSALGQDLLILEHLWT